MRAFLIVTVSLMVLTQVAFAQNRSVYTSTKTTACKTIRSTSDEAGSYEGECKGVGGYKLRVSEGDLRQTVDVMTPSRRKFELGLWNFYGGFSSIGERIEWRTKAGKPVALIVRFNVASSEDSSKSTSYLMVAKIGPANSCVTDVVEPGANQNERARKLADAAAQKPCKKS